MQNKWLDFTIFEKKIFRNIFISLTLSWLILIVAYGLASYPMQKDAHLEALHSQAKTLADSITLVCEGAMVNEDDSFIIEHNMAVLKNNQDIFEIKVIKRDGTVLKTTKDKWEMLDQFDENIDLKEHASETYGILYDEDIEQEVFEFTMPIVISTFNWGWLHMDFSLEQYNQNLNQTNLFLIYLTLGSMLMVLAITYVLSRYILGPIFELTTTSQKVSDGNLDIRANINRDDEIGTFAKDFNQMITNLARSKDELKHSHDQLELRVKERTQALAQKSKELQELNKNLDQRVKEESAKSRQNEQLLIQQSRQAAMGEMIGNIAHQWRQPLNALGLVLQNIHFTYQMDELDDEFMKKSVDKGKMLTSTMSKTIDDFRDFFKPNKLKENFNIAESIKKTIGLIEASYQNNNIHLDIDLDESLQIKGYPSEFSQVILNILSNAKDALLEHQQGAKRVMIRGIEEEGIAKIEIEDNAGGIPSEIIQKVFDPYFSTKEEGKGTGIGLYMSKTIIETNMNGKLSVKNSDIGAAFTIELALEKELAYA